ncbi:hypothetical protein CE195_00425, partial [Sodalis-like symbiont of Philaenus spumarius]
MIVSKSNTTAVIAEMTELIAIHLSLAGFDDEKAELAAGNIVDELRRQFGGINLYFPKGVHQDYSARRAEIYESYK